MKFNLRKAEPRDIPQILDLITELAVFEKAPDQVEITEANLFDDLFGEDFIIECIVAEEGLKLLGIAVFYEKYSTWKGRCLYLEDIIVTKVARGSGIGKALFNSVAEIGKQRNYGRMEWQVLDWNAPAIEFYKGFNAVIDPEWLNCKFTREQLQAMDL
jgi:GNAT superfamily N-acetyltransferase